MDIPPQVSANPSDEARCDFIYSSLHLLLLRLHAYNKRRRLSGASVRMPTMISMVPAPPVLQPIIDLLQYQVFCERIHGEMSQIVQALQNAGVTTRFHFDAVSENGDELVRLVSEDGSGHVGGEAIIRIDNR